MSKIDQTFPSLNYWLLKLALKGVAVKNARAYKNTRGDKTARVHKNARR